LQSVWFEKLFERRAGREVPLDDGEEDIERVVVGDFDGCDIYDFRPIIYGMRGDELNFEALLIAMEDSMYVARCPQLIDR
jgi:hypothetical protein